jgi:hypothetical protein
MVLVNRKQTKAWILHYGKVSDFGYLRILELEGINGRTLTAALDKVGRDFKDFEGMIIDIRDCPGGDDDTANHDHQSVLRPQESCLSPPDKTWPGEDDFTLLKTWHIEPEGDTRFTGTDRAVDL